MDSGTRSPSLGAHPSLNRIGGSSSTTRDHLQHDDNRPWNNLASPGRRYDVGRPVPRTKVSRVIDDTRLGPLVVRYRSQFPG
jgi:hypothetical protein